MMDKKKTYWSRALNVILISLLLLFLFSSDAKVWLLKQVVATGLLSPVIKKGAGNEANSSNAQSFSFQDVNGNIKTTSDLKGKVVFINFWATWCPPCRAEMPSLNSLFNTFKDDDRIVFLFISEDDDFDKAKDYWQKNGWEMPLYYRTSAVPATFFSGSLPTTAIINAKGELVMKHEGIASYNTSAFISQLRELL
jgi:thiol-disulfide isomerase/thioredoxin